MSLCILEDRRRWHELIDHIEMRIANEFMNPPRKFKEKVLQDYYIASLADELTATVALLLNSYKNDDDLVKKEMTKCHTNIDMSEFYTALMAVKEKHRLNPSEELVLPVEDMLLAKKGEFTEQTIESKFSDEEHVGRFLDLNECYLAFINLNRTEPIDYISYLDKLDSFSFFSPKQKEEAAYGKYLLDMIEYLEGFITRAKPLIMVSECKSEAQHQFNLIHKDIFVEDLFCVPCKKLFTNESVFKAHLSGKKHLKALAEGSSDTIDKASVLDDLFRKKREIPWREFYIQHLLRILQSVRIDTKAHVERKQSQSLEEREQDADDIEVEEIMAESLVEDEDTDKLYNPLRLPLGWDGKPIPYWLFKLHGLGIKFPCEICGNYVYMGRKAYEKHFQEWRHSLGMKCLGIPNTKHFQDISKIDDAYTLYDELRKASTKKSSFKPELEEFEDDQGHVYNRKTFEDLHRQGLL